MAVDACHFHEGFPTPDTLVLAHAVLDHVTGLSPCIALRFRRLHADVPALHASPNTTLPRRASVWARPLSLAVTNGVSLRFLFLPVLRCFNSRRSPLREAIAVGIPIRRSRVLRLRAASSGLSQLGTSFVGFRAEPSTRWRSSQSDGGSLVRGNGQMIRWWILRPSKRTDNPTLGRPSVETDKQSDDDPLVHIMDESSERLDCTYTRSHRSPPR